MKTVKIVVLTAFCFASLAMFGQEQKPNLQQLDHDIVTWKARDKAVNDVKSWALIGTIGLGIAVVATDYGFFLCDQRNYRLGFLSYTVFKLVSSATKFGAKFFGCALLLDLIASKYTTSIVTELEKAKERFIKTQATI